MSSENESSSSENLAGVVTPTKTSDQPISITETEFVTHATSKRILRKDVDTKGNEIIGKLHVPKKKRW